MFHSGDQLGPYVLIRELGHGAFGVVWLAERRGGLATTRFAIKLPRRSGIDITRFRQEAEAWQQANNHPNVLPIIEADIYDGQVAIVAEYAPDGSLENGCRDIVERHRRIMKRLRWLPEF